MSATLLVLLVLTLGQKFIGFLRSVLICRLLPPEELGTWAMMNTLILTATPLVLLSIPACFGRYCESFRTRGQLRGFVRQASLICSIFLLAGVTLLWLFPHHVARWALGTPELSWVVATCSLALIPFAAFAFTMELILALRLGRQASIANFLSTVILAVMSVLLLTLWESTALAMLVAFGVAYTLPLAWNLIRLSSVSRELPLDVCRLPWRTTWLSLLPIIFMFWLSDFLSNVFYLVDRYMLVNLLPGESTGIMAQIGNYEAAHVLPLVYMAITAWVAKTLMPYLARSWEAGEHALVVQQVLFSLKLVGFGSLLSGLVLIALSDHLFAILFAGKYAAAVQLLPLTIVFYIGCGMTTLMLNYFWCVGQARWALLALMVGCVVNVGINYLSIPLYGILGAAWGTTGGIVGQMLVLWILAHRIGLSYDRGVFILSGSLGLLFLPPPWIPFGLLITASMFVVPGVWTATDRQKIAEACQTLSRRLLPSR